MCSLLHAIQHLKRTDLVKKPHDVHIANVVEKSSAKFKITKMLAEE